MTSIQIGAQALLGGFGDLLLRRQVFIRRLQWGIVAGYAALLVVPVVLPCVIPFWTSYPPSEDVHLLIKAS